MYQQVNPNEMPGVGTSYLTVNKSPWKSKTGVMYLPGGGTIDGTKSRDVANTLAAASYPQVPNLATSYSGILQPGLLMGRNSTTKLYQPSIVGVIGTAITSGTKTSITVPAAVATEVDRLVKAAGGSLAMVLISEPTVGGTKAATNFTATATTATAITISSVSLPDATANSWVALQDGSQFPITFIDEEDGIRVTAADGSSVSLVQFPRIPVGEGVVATANLVNYPPAAATSLIAYIKASLRGTATGQTAGGGGTWIFDDDFGI